MHARWFARAIGLATMLLPGLAAAQGASELCRSAIAATERATGVPDRLMQAVAVVESGRRGADGVVAPWPWTINVEGAGYLFDSKQEAIAAVNAHRARGARSIDVGCMQVNLLYHGAAFPSLEDAFDPVSNTRYAASFLQQLLGQTGSWPRAVAGYHSLTPGIGEDYAKKVLAVWARPETGRPAPPAPRVAAPPPAIGPAAPLPSMPSASGGRILAASTGPGAVGRGLDSYRALPTRLAAGTQYRR